MVHHGQRLSFGFKPGDHLTGVHPELDDLERDLAHDRFALFGHVNHTHSPFADFLQQFVTADVIAGRLL
jgi:hypothetical protein